MKKIMLSLLLALSVAAGASASQTTMHEEGERFKFDYPVFSQTSVKAAQRMNKDITKLLQNSRRLLQDEYIAQVATDYEVYFENPQYVSFTFNSYQYYRSAAHGMSYLQGYVYDKASGKKVPYTRFTAPLDAEQLKHDILNKKVTVYCQDLKTTSDAPFLPYNTDFNVSKNYVLDKDGKALYLIYQAYDLDCYAAGPLFVKIPLSEKL